MKPIIEFRNIGKKFRINRRQKPYVSLRENILEYLKNPGLIFEKKEEFWALKDITFDVMSGESIGIIGKNGAGKTTLLKILSRITPPTTGEIKVRGRVASLLEVGTGFHPELTGRENVFFNGAILGMRRGEIKKKFDEIVDFAGVEKFIDTPLKHYSSGMQLRLAFAVAAFLEAEILVVDEVLAVGDAEFQKKCLGKMEDVTKNEGKTVLFVSHNMETLRSLCKKGIILIKGNSTGIIPINEAINKYLNLFNVSKVNYIENINKFKEIYDREVGIMELGILNEKNELSSTFNVDENIILYMKYYVNNAKYVMPNFLIINEYGIKVMMGTDAKSDFKSDKKSKKGIYITRFIIPKNMLNANTYYVHFSLDSPIEAACYEVRYNALSFIVIDKMDMSSFHRGMLRKNYHDIATWPVLNSETIFLEEI